MPARSVETNTMRVPSGERTNEAPMVVGTRHDVRAQIERDAVRSAQGRLGRRTHPEPSQGGDRCRKHREGDGHTRPPEQAAPHRKRLRAFGWSVSAAFGNPSQLASDIADVLPALVRVLRETPRHDVVQQARGQWLARRDRRRLIPQDRADDRRGGWTVERAMTGRHLVDHRAEGPDVAPRVGLAALDLLGRHVVHGPDEGARRRDRRVGHELRDAGRRVLRRWRQHLRQAEVQQLRPGARQHDVGGLEIAMRDVGAMRALHRAGDLQADTQHVVERQRTPAREPRGQRLALETRHHQIQQAVVLADVVHAADVRIVEGGDGARLAFEARTQVGVGAASDVRRDDLEGDGATEAHVAGAIHLAHAPGSEVAEDFVRADSLTRCETHGVGPGRRARTAAGHEPAPASPALSCLPQWP